MADETTVIACLRMEADNLTRLPFQSATMREATDKAAGMLREIADRLEGGEHGEAQG